MNAWLWAALAVLAGFLPCGVVCLREPRPDALAAVELAGALTTVELLLLAEGFDRDAYFALPLVFALLTLMGALAFVRMMERRL